MTTTAQPDFATLDARLTGAVLTAADGGWDQARQAWNLIADQRPVAVVQAADAGDVEATVRFAADHGLRVAPQGTGHAAPQHADLDATILLRTDRMRGIEVDAEARRARVQAGVLSLEVAERTGEHGLTALLGSSIDVGVVGFTLGGGLGWLGRSHGLACNSVVSIDVVTGDGKQVRADASSEPDLFWALRGGGGSFGVVSAIELQLYPLSELFAGDVMFDVEHAPALLRRYRDWAALAPPEVTSSIRLLTPPPIPDVPEPIRGRPLVTVTAAHSGDAGQAQELLRPLREAAPAIVDTYASIPAGGLCRIHGDPEQPVPGLTAGTVLSELPDQAIDALLEATAGSSLLSVDLRQLGGALAEAAPGGGAQAALPGVYAVGAVGAPMGPVTPEAVRSDLERVVMALEPWSTGMTFVNFDDRPGDGSASFSAQDHQRLREVKARVDPGRIIRGGQDVPPAD